MIFLKLYISELKQIVEATQVKNKLIEKAKTLSKNEFLRLNGETITIQKLKKIDDRILANDNYIVDSEIKLIVANIFKSIADDVIKKVQKYVGTERYYKNIANSFSFDMLEKENKLSKEAIKYIKVLKGKKDDRVVIFNNNGKFALTNFEATIVLNNINYPFKNNYSFSSKEVSSLKPSSIVYEKDDKIYNSSENIGIIEETYKVPQVDGINYNIDASILNDLANIVDVNNYKKELKGILFDSENDRLVATDTKILKIVNCDLKGSDKIILPIEFYSKLRFKGVLNVTLSNDFSMFDNGSITFYIKSINAKYPDIDRIIPKWDKEIFINNTSFLIPPATNSMHMRLLIQNGKICVYYEYGSEYIFMETDTKVNEHFSTIFDYKQLKKVIGNKDKFTLLTSERPYGIKTDNELSLIMPFSNDTINQEVEVKEINNGIGIDTNKLEEALNKLTEVNMKDRSALQSHIGIYTNNGKIYIRELTTHNPKHIEVGKSNRELQTTINYTYLKNFVKLYKKYGIILKLDRIKDYTYLQINNIFGKTANFYNTDFDLRNDVFQR